MFPQAFKWFTSKSIDLSLLNQKLYLSECLNVQRETSVELNLAIEEHRALSKNSDETLLNASLSRIDHLEKYSQFLELCVHAFENHQPSADDQAPHQVTLCTLMLNIITFPVNVIEDTVAAIFAQCLEVSPLITNKFLKNYLEARFQSNTHNPVANEIGIIMSQVLVNLKLNELTTHLKFQVNPLSAASLFPEYNPINFAACIIWMRKKGIPLNQLLRAGLLHKMVEYYLPTIGEKSFHELTLFYALLGKCSYTKPLVNIASIISWDKRGTDNYFNLLGHPSSTARPILVIEKSPSFTRNINNIKQLLTFYPEATFADIINQLFYDSNDNVDRFLLENVSQFTTLLSPSLFKRIAEDHYDSLKKWSSFIGDDLFEYSLHRKELSILYFLPFKPHWVSHLDSGMTASFLELIKLNHNDEAKAPETIQLLMSLYEAFESQKSPESKQVFHVLFDFSINHFYLIDDVRICRILKSSPYLDEYLDEFANGLYKQLLEEIDVFIQGPITNGNFVRLKSEWLRLSSQLDMDLITERVKYILPANEVDFMVHVCKQYAQRVHPNWSILLIAFGLRYRTPAFQQCVLLNIMVNVDALPLRTHILNKLQLTQLSFKRTMHSILLDAIGVGNLGFVAWYLEKHKIDDEMVKRAISTKQWPLFQVWYNKKYDFSKLNADTLDKLLLLCVLSSNIGVVNTSATSGDDETSTADLLLTELLKLNETVKSRRSPLPRLNGIFNETGISTAFIEAAKLNNPLMLRHLYKLKPTAKTMRDALKEAVIGERYEALRFFEAINTQNTELLIEVESALTIAINNNDQKLLDALMRFRGNAPTDAMLKKAMQKLHDKPMFKEMAAYLMELIKRPRRNQRLTLMPSRTLPATSSVSTNSLNELSVFSSPLLRNPEQRELSFESSKGAQTPL